MQNTLWVSSGHRVSDGPYVGPRISCGRSVSMGVGIWWRKSCRGTLRVLASRPQWARVALTNDFELEAEERGGGARKEGGVKGGWAWTVLMVHGGRRSVGLH